MASNRLTNIYSYVELSRSVFVRAPDGQDIEAEPMNDVPCIVVLI
jgi:hypothetical protein